MKLLYRIICVLIIFVIAKMIYGFIYSNETKFQIVSAKNTDEANSSYIIENSDTTILQIDNAIRRFLREEHLSGGASIAIAKNGKLVYAKGIGFSDVEDSIPMMPYNIMRVASVSKLITAVAIMKLVEDGRVGLHQKVFGPLGILNDDKYLAFKDRRMGEVTVYQLLNHSGGWTSRYGDPMFMPYVIAQQMGREMPISMEDIIRFMQSKSMHFKPGTGSFYSNFGYGILGEIIAKASGMPYEDYVKSEVLAPLGIYDMQIGYSYLSERLPLEAKYYEADTSHVAIDYTGEGSMVRRAYGGTDIQTLGSAGGWTASATDLLKLVLTIDGFNTVKDQLEEESIDTMVHHVAGYDPLGWRSTTSDFQSWYRSGTLAATSAMIARHPNGICYVIILNCSNHRGPGVATSLRYLVDRAIQNVSWPDIDLYNLDERWNYYKTCD